MEFLCFLVFFFMSKTIGMPKKKLLRYKEEAWPSLSQLVFTLLADLEHFHKPHSEILLTFVRGIFSGLLYFFDHLPSPCSCQ